ncbi:MAG: hypothetical protein ACYDH5_11275 [Acidimicrobiales bacterium]
MGVGAVVEVVVAGTVVVGAVLVVVEDGAAVVDVEVLETKPFAA